MRILFTSVGRRVELIQAFRRSANNLNIDLDIVGADVSVSAPALRFCDAIIQTPLISERDYIPFLITYCMSNGIDALIPTIDTDLLLLSENKSSFKSTRVIVSSSDMIRICRDKRLTSDFFMRIGLNCPQTTDDVNHYTWGFPAFIKPIDGSSSINAFVVHNQTELELFSKLIPNYIIQPYIDGTEYTVDAFCDYDGLPICITPRIRLAVRSGEVLKTKVCLDKRIQAEMVKLIEAFKPVGPLTVQLIRDNITGDDYFIEINPRYGGGAPLSMKAGANSSEALLKLLTGRTIDCNDYIADDGALFCRFDQSIRIT